MNFDRSVLNDLWFLHGTVVGTLNFFVLHINFRKFNNSDNKNETKAELLTEIVFNRLLTNVH